jgi:surface protein
MFLSRGWGRTPSHKRSSHCTRRSKACPLRAALRDTLLLFAHSRNARMDSRVVNQPEDIVPPFNNPETAADVSSPIISPTFDSKLLEFGLLDKDVTHRCDDCEVSILSDESHAVPFLPVSQRSQFLFTVVFTVLLSIAIGVAGVCGSGLCRREKSEVSNTAPEIGVPCRCNPVTSPVSAHSVSPIRTTVAPIAAPTAVVAPPRRAFTTTEELYNAVDEYLLSGAAVNPEYGHPIGVWNVSLLTNLSHVFDAFRRNPRAYYFNENLTGWDTSRVVTMEDLFLDARSFDGDVSTWNTGRVTSMRETFGRATSFRGDVSRWDVSRVTTMERMCT